MVGDGLEKKEEEHCWSCRSPVGDDPFFCASCGLVQPLTHLDPFAMFSLAADYLPDPSRLEPEYLRLQRLLHPDRFPRAEKKEKMVAQMACASVNQAYETLRDPVRRAVHLLERVGVKAEAGGEKTIQDPELLMRAMEDREALAEARDTDRIDAIADSAKSEEKDVIRALADLWRGQKWDDMNRQLTRLKYLIKLGDEIATARRRLASLGAASSMVGSSSR